MANDQLTITGGSGGASQTTTQSPQSDVRSLNTGTQSGSLQPGTPATSLNSGQGIPLQNTQLSTVSLDTQASAPVSTAAASPPKHHAIPVLLGFAVVLFLAAMVLFWVMGKTAKDTV